MKILYSCLSRSWGGMEMYTLTSVKQLLSSKIQVEILCLKNSTLESEAKRSGIVIHTVNSANYLSLTGIYKINSLLRKGKFNLIHTQSSRDLWLLIPSLKLTKIKTPLILTKHIGSYIVKKDFLHKIIYNRVDMAFAISSAMRQNLIYSTPMPSDKIFLIHNCININDFDPDKSLRKKIRREFGVGDSEVVVGMMARFSPGKGHEEFLNAARQLKQKYDNLKFLIVGKASYGEEKYEYEIKALAKKLELNEVFFAGFRTDTADVLSAMDIFVFPSHAEAFGIALIEAMAMELPTVSSNAEGVLDITIDGQTGLLFENKNAEDLANKIAKLVESKEMRIKFGKSGRERVKDNFNLDLQTEKIVNLYLSLISNKR